MAAEQGPHRKQIFRCEELLLRLVRVEISVDEGGIEEEEECVCNRASDVVACFLSNR